MNRAKPFHIVQTARTIGPGYGVSGPSWQLERSWLRSGYSCSRFTLDNLGLQTTSMPDGNHWRAVFRLWRDIVLFSTIGTAILWTRYRRRQPNQVIVTQIDALYGDVFVVRSLHRQFLGRHRNRTLMMLRNPLHAFVLARDWIRFKSRIHSHFVALSEPNKQEIIEHYQVPPERITVIPNGVDLERFKPESDWRREVRAELHLSDEQPVLIFVGHEFERKGLRFLLEAVRLLKKTGVDLPVLIAGRECPTAVQSEFSDLRGLLHFLGNRTDIERYYAASDVMVMPTLHDISPLVGPEALAAGLPILMTNIGGAGEYLKDGVNGWFIKRDGAEIAEKLERLVRDPEELKRMQSAARASILERSWDRIAERYLDLFRDLGYDA